jgi:hypothetical protein
LLSVGAAAAVAVAAVHRACTLPVQLHGASQCKLAGQLRPAASTERSNMLYCCRVLASSPSFQETLH